jgi:hypothetical protein
MPIVLQATANNNYLHKLNFQTELHTHSYSVTLIAKEQRMSAVVNRNIYIYIYTHIHTGYTTLEIASRAEVKNEWSYTHTLPLRLHGVDRTNFHKRNRILLALAIYYFANY